MNTCKTCKLWQPVSASYQSAEYRAGGLCTSDLIAEDYGDNPPNALRYPYNEGAGHFWTGPEFGCVNHERQQ